MLETLLTPTTPCTSPSPTRRSILAKRPITASELLSPAQKQSSFLNVNSTKGRHECKLDYDGDGAANATLSIGGMGSWTCEKLVLEVVAQNADLMFENAFRPPVNQSNMALRGKHL